MYLLLNEFGDAWIILGELPAVYLEETGNGYADLFRITGDKVERYSSTGDWTPVKELPK